MPSIVCMFGAFWQLGLCWVDCSKLGGFWWNLDAIPLLGR